MNKRTRWGIGLAVLAIAAAGIVAHTGFRRERRVCSFPVMGTVASVTVYGSAAQGRLAVQLTRNEFALVNKIAAVRDPNSELSRLNAAARTGRSFTCSAELWELLSAARRAYKLSDGAFDISIKPLMDLWGFYRRRQLVPTAREIAAVRLKVGLEKISFDDATRTVGFSVPGMALDLGGIAKGYALDRACRAVVAANIRRGVLDLGGNLRLLPEPPPGKKCYRVGVRRPVPGAGVLPEPLELPGGVGVSTSGDYERFVELGGRRYGHIVDPATGVPAPGTVAVTVVTPFAMRADWLSTALYLRGQTLADRLQKLWPEIIVVILKK